MDIDSFLDKLKNETTKKGFNADVVMDTSSENEVGSVWYSAGYTEDDDAYFEGEEFENFEKTGCFPVEGPQWEEALQTYVDECWDEFASDFAQHAKTENGKLLIYRVLTVPNINKFLTLLKKGEVAEGRKGIGIYWSWDKSRADAHWGGSHKSWVTLTALVDFKDISLNATARKNLNPVLGEDEAEIEVKKNAKLTIIKVEDNNDQVVWEKGKSKEIRIGASKRRKEDNTSNNKIGLEQQLEKSELLSFLRRLVSDYPHFKNG